MADNKSNKKKRERSETDVPRSSPAPSSVDLAEPMETGSEATTPTSDSSLSSSCSSSGSDSAMENGFAEAEVKSPDDCVAAPEKKRSANEIEDTAARERLAEEKKVEGNACYGKKDYSTAVRLYTEAIELCPMCAAYYSNRAAGYMMLGRPEKALEDARRSTQINPTFVKGYHREAKCHLAMGEAATATLCYEKIISMEPTNKTYQTESLQAKAVQQYMRKAEELYAKQDYRSIIFCMDKSIELSPECRKFKVTKAECLALLKRYQEAQEIVNDILRQDSMSADAIYVRGLCLYYQDSIDKAFQHFQQVLRLAPDHSKARDVYRKAKALTQKKDEGNTAFKQGRIQAAYDLYTEALAIDPKNVFTNSKLYFNRATASAKLTKHEDAISDCTRAVELDENYIKAYLRRAKSYMETEQYEDAVRDYEKIFKMDKTRENKQLLQDAKLELKKSKRKDYYKLLGVSKGANDDEIKKAYRKHALLHHPDRHMNATDSDKKEQERKFKEVGEAYGVLSDPKKKARYDSGQDLEEHEGMSGFHDMDPNFIFQNFFGGAGGPGGFGGGGFQQAGGIPGGFSFQFG